VAERKVVTNGPKSAGRGRPAGAKAAATRGRPAGAKASSAGKVTQDKMKAAQKPASRGAKKAPAKKRPVKMTMSLDPELLGIVQESIELEGIERDKSGAMRSFIAIAQGTTDVIVPGTDKYIEGINVLDYYIGNKELVLGREFEADILGIFLLYQEVIPAPPRADGSRDMGTFVAVRMPEYAYQFPKEGTFDRVTPEGHVLSPIHWMFVRLPEYPEIDDAVITFRSKGNAFCSAIEKVLKKESLIAPELRVIIGQEGADSKVGKQTKTYYYPTIEVIGRNFTVTEDGQVELEEADEELARHLLEWHHALHKDYAENKMASGAEALPPGQQKQLEGPDGYQAEEDDEDIEGDYEAEDDEDENIPNF